MKIAFISDPLSSFKIEKDSTYAMMRAAAARGHTLYSLQQEDLVWNGAEVVGHARALTLTATQDKHWYRLETGDGDQMPASTPLTAFDAVLMRKDPPFDMEYVYSTYLLELAQAQGARIFNDPRAIRDHNEKLSIARFPQFTPPTIVARDLAVLRAFLAEHGDIILKPLDGMGGMSIFRVRLGDPNLNVIFETVTQLGRRTVMAQRFVPEISAGDKRILLLNGAPVPYALARIPAPGETRGNLAAGGTGVARPLTARDQEIATTVGAALAQQGLLLVGLDVIGDYLTEINVTSPTGFQEITRQTGCPVADLFLDALEAVVR